MGILFNGFKVIKDSYPKKRFIQTFTSSEVDSDMVQTMKFSVVSDVRCGNVDILSKSALKKGLQMVLKKKDVSNEIQKIENGGFFCVAIDFNTNSPSSFSHLLSCEDINYVVFYSTNISNSELYT